MSLIPVNGNWTRIRSDFQNQNQNLFLWTRPRTIFPVPLMCGALQKSKELPNTSFNMGSSEANWAKGKTLATGTIRQSIDGPNLHLNPSLPNADMKMAHHVTDYKKNKTCKILVLVSSMYVKYFMAECFVFQGCVCQKLTMQNTIEKFWPYVFAMYMFIS